MTGALPEIQTALHTRSAAPLLVLQLRGSQEAMGAQHGAMLRANGDWEKSIDFYPEMPARLLTRGGKSRLGQLAMRTLSRPALEFALARLERRRDPELRARTRAFMTALGKPASFSRYVQVMDLLQNVIGSAGKLGFGPFKKRIGGALPPACSSLVTWGDASADGTLKHARNFDFPGIAVWEKQPAVVFCSPKDGLRYGFITTRGADTPSISAFNEAGLVFTSHTRFHQDVNWHGRGVIDLGHDIIRRSESIDDAIRIARSAPIASSWGLCISSAREQRAVVIETSGAKVGVLEAGPGESFIACTNRYHHPDIVPGQVTISPAFVANSEGRETVLREHARKHPLTLLELKHLLGSHEQPDSAAERATGSVLAQCMSVQSVVIEPEQQQLHISLGDAPTGKGPWLALPWAWDDEVGSRVVKLDESVPQPVGSTTSRYVAQDNAAKGYAEYIEGARIDGEAGPVEDVARAIDRAASLDPEEPSYRFLTGAFHLRDGKTQAALGHFEAGLQREASPFYRGQFHLWAMRAATELGDTATAAHHRQQLFQSTHPLLAEHRRCASEEQTHPFSSRKLRRLQVHLHFMDASVM